MFFNEAARRIGATLVNGLRILVAVVLLAVTHRLLAGQWVPPAQVGQVAFLVLSGWIGLNLGDQALFMAFERVGPRTAMLMMTTGAPLFAALLGWLVLGETIPAAGWLGVAAMLAGVAWVVLGRQVGDTRSAPRPQFGAGIALGLLAALCQAGGFLLSKQGIGHGWLPDQQHLQPQAATLLRMAGAAVLAVPIVAWRLRRASRAPAGGPTPAPGHAFYAGIGLTFCGSLVGPYLGVWMSLEAAHRIPLGLAQTLASLPPVLVLPIAAILYRERVGVRAVCGALLAVAGAAWLMLTP